MYIFGNLCHGDGGDDDVDDDNDNDRKTMTMMMMVINRITIVVNIGVNTLTGKLIIYLGISAHNMDKDRNK